MANKLIMASIAMVVIGAVGYCVYFDKKRRRDPLYKQKVRKNREKAQETQAHVNLTDEDIAKLEFMENLRIGEQLLQAGKLKHAVHHFSNALIDCKDGLEMLQANRLQLPPVVYHKVRARLETRDMLTFNNLAKKRERPGQAGLDCLD